MKTTIKLIAIALVLFLNSCKKDTDNTPALQCKLSVIDRGNGNKHTYSYDASGKITTMTREFDGDGSGKISKYVYTLTYDATGLLISSAITLDGKVYGKENYTYTSGKISKATYENIDGSKGYNAIKYNSNGQITEFTFQTVEKPDDDAMQYFEYDANGIMVKRGFSDITGKIKFFEVVTKPVGFIKSPESLISSCGLPYDLLTGFSYQLAEGGVGTTFDVFELDENGVFADVNDSSKTTAIKSNSKGFLTESTVTDKANKSYIQKFELLDCN